jgi:hypothetical protein
MRRGAACVLAWALSLGVQAAAQASVPCRPGPGTITIAHSSKASVFEDEHDGNDYACLYSDGHPRLLSTSEHFAYEHVRFAGSYVAYVQNIEGSDDAVGVTNLRTGHTARFTEVERPIGRFIGGVADALVLKSDGAVAWIATNAVAEEMSPPGPDVEVRVHDRRGLRTVESGAIAPTSLRLSGSTLRWLNAGQSRSTTLR